MQKSLIQMTASEIITLLQPPRPEPKWTSERIKQAERMRADGVLDHAIAQKLRVPSKDVSEVLCPVKRAAVTRAFWRKESNDESLIADWNAGLSGGAIAAKMGIRRRAVFHRLKRLRLHGVFLRTGCVAGVSLVERHRVLIEKWNVGYSAGLLAVEFKTTRNVIIGLVQRIRGSGVFMRSSPPLVSAKPKSRKRK